MRTAAWTLWFLLPICEPVERYSPYDPRITEATHGPVTVLMAGIYTAD